LPSPSVFLYVTPTTEIYTLSYTTLFRSAPGLSPATPTIQRTAPRAPASGSSACEIVGQVSRKNRSLWNTPAIIVAAMTATIIARSEEHTSELQSRFDLVCRLLLEKKNTY